MSVADKRGAAPTPRWKKFGACQAAEGPERGITIVCGRRPVEFGWSDLAERKYSEDECRRMRAEFEKYLASKQSGDSVALPSLVQHGGISKSSDTTSVARAENRTTTIERRNLSNDTSPRKFVKKPPGFSQTPPQASGAASHSTLAKDAAEFIPQQMSHTQPQPVQWLNNDINTQSESNERPPFPSGNRQNGQRAGIMGEMDNQGFIKEPSNFFNESGDPNSPYRTNMAAHGHQPNPRMPENVEGRRRGAVSDMKAKLKEHYRLLYSKYKEYVAKRVPEKVEEYYMRLKHCQAQYMKLKYYEYKTSLASQIPHSRQQLTSVPSQGGRLRIPDNNPWQSRTEFNPQAADYNDKRQINPSNFGGRGGPDPWNESQQASYGQQMPSHGSRSHVPMHYKDDGPGPQANPWAVGGGTGNQAAANQPEHHYGSAPTAREQSRDMPFSTGNSEPAQGASQGASAFTMGDGYSPENRGVNPYNGSSQSWGGGFGGPPPANNPWKRDATQNRYNGF